VVKKFVGFGPIGILQEWNIGATWLKYAPAFVIFQNQSRWNRGEESQPALARQDCNKLLSL
jgi:hypothetical protein